MRLSILFGLFASLGGVGCATAKNVERAEPKVFGGTTMAYGKLVSQGDEPPGLGAGITAPVLWPLWLADKPLSLAADCATLPYVLWKRMEYRRPQIDRNPPGLREVLAREPSPRAEMILSEEAIKRTNHPVYPLPPAGASPMPAASKCRVVSGKPSVVNERVSRAFKDAGVFGGACAALLDEQGENISVHGGTPDGRKFHLNLQQVGSNSTQVGIRWESQPDDKLSTAILAGLAKK